MSNYIIKVIKNHFSFIVLCMSAIMFIDIALEIHIFYLVDGFQIYPNTSVPVSTFYQTSYIMFIPVIMIIILFPLFFFFSLDNKEDVNNDN